MISVYDNSIVNEFEEIKMRLLTIFMVILTNLALATDDNDNKIFKSTIKCIKEGCSIVCHQPGNRWDTFLKTEGNIEVTHYNMSGNIRYKAPVEDGEYAILETNPNTQFCRITGIAK